jgi:alkanesulfonate monooxygenase SsuD/methylene tetrahydromethanopterin reductase-like flavin-dependent oxidoreductase (luciferase family)
MEYQVFVVGEQVPGISHTATLEHILDLVKIADRSGLDTFFFAEHHCDPSFSVIPSPNLLIAASSRITKDIRLGTLVTVLPYHHPLRIAEEIRLLDAMTNGRLELGFGRGAIRTEQQAYGVDRQRTPEIFEAGMSLVLRFLTEENAEYDTEWWRGSVPRVAPAATQAPHPPIWIATVSETSLLRAARLGAHASTTLIPLSQAIETRERYHEAWQQHQGARAPGKFAVGVTIAVAETRAEAESFAREQLEQRSATFLAQISDRPAAKDDPAYADHEKGWRQFVDSSFTDLVDDGFIVYGDVDDCIEQVQAIVASGVEAVSVIPQFLNLDYDFAKRSLRLFAEEVVPKATAT